MQLVGQCHSSITVPIQLKLWGKKVLVCVVAVFSQYRPVFRFIYVAKST